jgi:predicted dehydrogenase
LIDIASHQIDQFLFYTGSSDAEIVTSSVGNFANPSDPGLQDYSEIMIRSENGQGYIRVDCYTPDADDSDSLLQSYGVSAKGASSGSAALEFSKAIAKPYVKNHDLV